MNILEKRLADITPQDIHWLIDNQIQEGSDLEFKEALSTKKGAPDRWVTTGDAVGEDAKSDLVKELVGFANAQGGALILGIKDSKTKPAKADGLASVPRVSELADRLKMACRDLIEPKLHSLEVRGVPMADDSSGVVVLRVNGGSPFAPHRHRGNKECYTRRNDETFPMNMVEIQRQSVELQQRFSRIDDEFGKFRSSVTDQLARLPSAGFSIGLLALPLGALVVPNIHRLPSAKPSFVSIPVTFPKGGTSEASLPVYSHLDWNPVLRGTSARRNEANETLEVTLTNDGRFVFTWAQVAHPIDRNARAHDQTQLFMAWMTGAVANALLGVERYRHAARALGAEFALEFIYAANDRLTFGDYNQPWYSTRNLLPSGEHVFPRYSIGPSETFDALMRLFEADVSNFSGADHPGHEPSYDFTNALALIDQSFKAP